MGEKALSKIRVLDFTQNLCGPVCTQYLADLGAEIIKIEPPDGDASRQRGEANDGSSIAYAFINRNKKSVKLDITDVKQNEILLNLAAKCDVVVEDFGVGIAEELGFGYEDVQKVNNKIVYVSITNFGRKGVLKDYPASDATLQAMCGYMSMTSMTMKGPATKITPQISDLLTGAYAAIGTIAGLIYRDKNADCIHVDVDKFGCLLNMIPDALSTYLTYGDVPYPTGNAHRASAVFYPMPAKDGAIICNPDNRSPLEHKWQGFCEDIGIPAEVYDSEKFNSLQTRLEHRSEVEELLNSHTVNFTIAELAAICSKYKIAHGVMYDMQQLSELPQTIHDRIIVNVHDDKAGDFRVLGSPLKYSAFETRSDGFVDSLGAHTQEVLMQVLGMTQQEVADAMSNMNE